MQKSNALSASRALFCFKTVLRNGFANVWHRLPGPWYSAVVFFPWGFWEQRVYLKPFACVAQATSSSGSLSRFFSAGFGLVQQRICYFACSSVLLRFCKAKNLTSDLVLQQTEFCRCQEDGAAWSAGQVHWTEGWSGIKKDLDMAGNPKSIVLATLNQRRSESF